jgi:glc operon protein GlcG
MTAQVKTQMLAAALALAGGPAAFGQVTQKRVLTLEGAKAALAAVMDESKRLKAPGAAVAIVDEGGHVICVERLDGTFAAASRISVGKARTSAAFRKPTSLFEKIIKEGRTPMIALEDFTPLQGGVPIMVEGEFVGAIGVSGAASAQQDEDLAQVGAAAVQAGMAVSSGRHSAGVLHFDSRRVNDAFAKGDVLVNAEGRNYMVHASRRDAPGMAEVHTRDTDIFHVLSGSATFVTGGDLVEPGPSADDEIRGKGIQGGETRRIAAGDVIVVPKGTPHWFREVQAPLTYYVVKVR